MIYQIIKLYPRRLFPSHAALFITPPWWKQVRSLTTNSGCHSMVPRFDEAQLMTSSPLSSVFPGAQGLSSASVCLVNNIVQYPKVLKHLFNFSYLFYQGLEPGIGYTPWLHSAPLRASFRPRRALELCALSLPGDGGICWNPERFAKN